MDVTLDDLEISEAHYYPIIRAFADKMNLVDTVNSRVPSEMDVSPGHYVLALVIDALSGRSPIFQLQQFFEGKDTELLLGEAIALESLAGHNVGRLLDKLYEYGTLKLFTEISRQAINAFDVDVRHVHSDTTSVSVQGAYEYDDGPFDITYGYSKDKRPDLKQFLVSMLCVDRNIPIVGTVEDGNASDKKINNDILNDISRHMATHGLTPGEFVYIADSAMVTEANLTQVGDVTKYLSRLPATYNECGRAIKEAVEADDWIDIGVLAKTKPTKNRPATHYLGYETEVTLYERTFRAIVVHSSAHDMRRQKRIDRELASERKELDKRCKDAAKREYFCLADAEAAAKDLEKEVPLYHTLTVNVEERPVYRRGRPPKDGQRKIDRMAYALSPQITEDPERTAALRKEGGCFVLVTNLKHDGVEETYSARDLLSLYKDQHGIEQNFGFLKDPAIVDSIFLKKPERIEVLGLILLIALLIWRLMERSMRRNLETTGKTVNGWMKRRTDLPTSYMMTTKFSAILVIKSGSARKLARPLTPVQKEYLEALGIGPEIFTKT